MIFPDFYIFFFIFSLCYFLLQDISTISQSVYVPRGVNVPALNQTKKWPFTPNTERYCQLGSIVTGGTVLGYVYENKLLPKHQIMVPPGVTGRLKTLVKAGNYNVTVSIVLIFCFHL